MRKLVKLLLLLLIFCLSLHAADKVNVILIMADDLAYGDIACYGSDKQRTPHLDKLAKEGVKLTNYFSGNTVCTPSRMALLTGAYPSRLGWKGGVVGYGVATNNGLAGDALTIAEIFKAEGYKTAISGKWHIGDVKPMLPMDQGFESAYYIRKSNNQTKKLFRDGELVEAPFKNPMLSEQFTNEAISFIKKNKDNPFFLYVPYTAPHFPAQSHPDWKGKSNNHMFGDVVEELDFRVGEIVKALKDNGIDKKTLVVFTSDNGTDGSQRKWGSVKPFRGIKWSSLEGGSRVACIFWMPGTVPADNESDNLTGAIDLLPTLVSAAGIDLKKHSKDSPKIDGVNTWNSILGKAEKHPRNDLLLWDGWANLQAIRVGDWKLYVDKVKDIKDSQKGPALFNVKTDLTEEKNVADQHPEKVKEMMALIKKRLADIEANSMPMGGPEAKPKRDTESSWLK